PGSCPLSDHLVASLPKVTSPSSSWRIPSPGRKRTKISLAKVSSSAAGPSPGQGPPGLPLSWQFLNCSSAPPASQQHLGQLASSPLPASTNSEESGWQVFHLVAVIGCDGPFSLALAVYCCCPVLLVHFLVGLWYSSLLLPFALLNGSLFPSLHFLCTARGLYMLLLNRLGVVPPFGSCPLLLVGCLWGQSVSLCLSTAACSSAGCCCQVHGSCILTLAYVA
ncbi:hypothetical protein H0E87_031716, partial [Populus deltoides]